MKFILKVTTKGSMDYEFEVNITYSSLKRCYYFKGHKFESARDVAYFVLGYLCPTIPLDDFVYICLLYLGRVHYIYGDKKHVAMVEVLIHASDFRRISKGENKWLNIVHETFPLNKALSLLSDYISLYKTLGYFVTVEKNGFMASKRYNNNHSRLVTFGFHSVL